jgi:hypothetical protein
MARIVRIPITNTITLEHLRLVARTMIILEHPTLYFIHVEHIPMFEFLHDPPVAAHPGVLQIKKLVCLCQQNERVIFVPE